MMMIQDKEIILFLNNQCTSSGKGSSQVGIAERDRKQQINLAVDFCNVANSEEDITQQVNELLNPTYYMLGKESGFKPPRECKSNMKRKMDDTCTSKEKQNEDEVEGSHKSKKKKTDEQEGQNEEENLNMGK